MNRGSDAHQPRDRRPRGSGLLAGTARRHAVVEALAQLATRRPVATYLVTSFALAWGLLFPAAFLAPQALQPLVIPASVVSQFGTSVVVTALVDGRAGLTDHLRRVFLWRVGAHWYLLAVAGLPSLALLLSPALGGADLEALVDSPGPVGGYLLGMAFLPLVNLWEESGWMAFVQSRLQDRHGPMVAAVLTAPLFALIHLPLLVRSPPGDALLTFAFLVAMGSGFRVIVGWLYNATRSSVVIAATFHASFNGFTGTEFIGQLLPGPPPDLVVAVVLAVGTLLVIVSTRGRLGLPPREVRVPPTRPRHCDALAERG